jgi:hypothetical protein
MISCFQPYVSLVQGDPVFSQFLTCLVQVENQCCMYNGDGGLELRDASAD